MHLTLQLPCSRARHTQWEAFLGGAKYGNDTMAKDMDRKISPVLNGMDVNRFRVNKALERDTPTAVMLSHVNRIKACSSVSSGLSLCCLFRFAPLLLS